MIYLDYAATTPADPRVIAKMLQFLGAESTFANPASRSHMLGWQAEAAVESARKSVARILNCDVREIVWTSGATESNNLAIKGSLEYLRNQGDTRRHIVTAATEHKAVLDVCAYLEEHHGYAVSYLKPNSNGVIDVQLLKDALREDTALVSIMHVNNETGAINPIEDLADVAKRAGALFHADCAQSAGKLPIDLNDLRADMISLCAHKLYGPKGIGALYVRRAADFEVCAQIHGGGHERSMRSGTLASHQIVGFAEALSVAHECRVNEQTSLQHLKTRFLEALGPEGVQQNGSLDTSIAGIVNLSFPGIDGQLLLSALPDLAISSGSACNSASVAPSHVLKAMGLSDEEALSALRFSFGRFTTQDDVESAAQKLRTALDRLA